MEENKHLKDIAEIRNLMEQSSRFISLSGLSGVAAGCVALIGAAMAYWYLNIYLPASGGPFSPALLRILQSKVLKQDDRD